MRCHVLIESVMLVFMSVEQIAIINAGLTRTGNTQITSLSDGSTNTGQSCRRSRNCAGTNRHTQPALRSVVFGRIIPRLDRRQCKTAIPYYDRKVADKVLSGRTALKSDNHALSVIAAYDDPQEAAIEAKAAFAQGRITQEDLKETLEETQAVDPKDRVKSTVSAFAKRIKLPDYMNA